jgi:hypothetical protein
VKKVKRVSGLFVVVAGRNEAHVALAGGAIQLDGIGKEQILLLYMRPMSPPVAFGAGDIVFAEYGG